MCQTEQKKKHGKMLTGEFDAHFEKPQKTSGVGCRLHTRSKLLLHAHDIPFHCLQIAMSVCLGPSKLVFIGKN